MTKKLKIAARLLRETIAPLGVEERRKVFSELLKMVVETERVEAPIARANRQGNPLECPYGIFKSRADATRYIEANYLNEFLKKYPNFKVMTYTDRISKIKDNNVNRHYIYHAIYAMCTDKNYTDWNFLEAKIKID